MRWYVGCMEAAVTRAKGIASEVMIIPLKDTIRTFFLHFPSDEYLHLQSGPDQDLSFDSKPADKVTRNPKWLYQSKRNRKRGHNLSTEGYDAHIFISLPLWWIFTYTFSLVQTKNWALTQNKLTKLQTTWLGYFWSMKYFLHFNQLGLFKDTTTFGSW